MRLYMATEFRVAHASRVLVAASRRNSLSFSNASRRKSVIARTRSPTRETRALPNPIFVVAQRIQFDAT